MNFMEIKFPDTANGPGIRVSLFVSGCNHHCKGCFNPESWAFEAGQTFDDAAKEQIKQVLQNPYVSGFSLLGGEPLDPRHAKDVTQLVQELRKERPGLNVWCWTGYTLEDLLLTNNADQMELLGELDVLVDGPFMESQKNLTLKFRGSANQRILDCRQSLVQHQAVLKD